jgi:hypothetical protein
VLDRLKQDSFCREQVLQNEKGRLNVEKHFLHLGRAVVEEVMNFKPLLLYFTNGER